eukprot:TRINITY_DN6744_c0_g1_i1.p2 TRINITY_DN6744_c0_g1~~TRINITY_DN6744_c0_g1_i1.p2  ORF type:complete len:278 (+),score=66.03 TRINITY_DN6744_c0_g1_i1:53-835(+)
MSTEHKNIGNTFIKQYYTKLTESPTETKEIFYDHSCVIHRGFIHDELAIEYPIDTDVLEMFHFEGAKIKVLSCLTFPVSCTSDLITINVGGILKNPNGFTTMFSQALIISHSEEGNVPYKIVNDIMNFITENPDDYRLYFKKPKSDAPQAEVVNTEEQTTNSSWANQIKQAPSKPPQKKTTKTKKPRIVKIFVGNLPRGITEEEVEETFSNFVDINTFVSFKLISHKGFGFIELPLQFAKVLHDSHIVIDGRKVNIDKAK